MKTPFLSSFRLAACLSAMLCSAAPSHAAGFPLGQVLVSDSTTVYLIDPVAGSATSIVSGLIGLADVVYNPVSGAAFPVIGSSIVRISPWGTKTSYSQQSWMDFVDEDDLAYDPASGTIYATSFGHGLYALYPDQTNRKLLNVGGSFFQGVSIIGSGAQCITRQPSNQVVAAGRAVVFSV